MKKRILSLSAIVALSFLGCGSSDEDNAKVNISPDQTTDVVVERGAVYDAVVSDAVGKIAIQKKGSNIYTFTGEVIYPISAKNGWIDVDGNGYMSYNDINQKIELKSYSNKLTPVSTYIADADISKRDKKLQDLVLLINNQTNQDYISSDLLELSSLATHDIQIVINALYMGMIEHNRKELTETEILDKISELQNLIFPEGLSSKETALLFESYIIEDSDFSLHFKDQKINAADYEKYKIPVMNLSEAQKNNKYITIIDNYPVNMLSNLKFENESSDKKVTYYRSSNADNNCEEDYADFARCNTFSTSIFQDGTETVSIVATVEADDKIDTTSENHIKDIEGRTFYTISLQDERHSETRYEVITKYDLLNMRTERAEYILKNGEWELENECSSTVSDGEKLISISYEGNKLKILENTVLYNGEERIDAYYLSIGEKTDEYWNYIVELSLGNDGNVVTISNTKWYLSPTYEILNPSEIEAN